MKKISWCLPFSISVFNLMALVVFAEPDQAAVVYSRDIKPILKARCFACHGTLKQEAGLRLDAGDSIRRGSKNGTVMTAGQASGALLERIRSNDDSDRMPPEGGPLSSDQITKITRWIEQGAVSPEGEQPELDPKAHWAFQRPVRPHVPEVANREWIRNPIDAFVSQLHTKQGLTPQPAAAKSTLLRRVTLDLIGLPPTRQELKEFLADESPEAYANVVERLLNSPQYGERWGRHCMDVWRYADWFGRRYVPDVWNSAPQIWRWRDWIVKSLNDDKSYAQMVAEMLAADEISPEDDEAGHATGYLIRNWYALNPNDWMRSNVEHTGKAFLGLTFNCAHCHDHKYDPISQDDYFRFRAFFEPISIRQERVPNEADPGPFQEYSYSVLRKINRLGAVRIFDKTLDAPTWFYTGGDERNRRADRGSIPAGLPVVLLNQPLAIDQVQLPPRAWYPGLRPSIHDTIRAEKRAALAVVESQLPAVRTAVEAVLPDLQLKLAEAQTEFDAAQRVVRQEGRLSALVGQQSLFIDATTGRRLLQHRLMQLASLDEGATIGFQLKIIKDAHVNFQLAKDVVKGLTAGYVGFENGRILSYQPASFTEFEVGRYDFAAGQNRFEVKLVLQSQADRCLLSVRSMPDGAFLVDNAVVAKNGWSPLGDPSKGICFDVRTGSVAAIDQIEIAPPAAVGVKAGSTAAARFDFESPTYRELSDVIGVDGWIGSSLNQAGATSIASGSYGDDSVKPLSLKLVAARRAVDVHALKLQSLESKLAASIAEQQSIEARIAADRAKHGEMPDTNVDDLAKIASRLHRTAAVLLAEAEALTKDQALAVAESKPAEDAARANEIAAASQQLSAATSALEAAQLAAADPAQEMLYPSFSPTYPQASTGRRRALALWLASRDNPLTARVAVNHIWLRHFQSPLVASVYDFGRNGSAPTHPELLDWLAVELMESGWSMKHLHRLMVNSSAYTMSSASDENGSRMRQIDPENRFLWRFNAGRMESEVVRDSLLSSAQQLDPQMGGQELENTQAMITRRRTIYYSCQPEIDGKSPFGALFDAPEPADCYRRSRSIIPQQALALTNSELIHGISLSLSASLWDSLKTDQQTNAIAFIVAAYEHILTRTPTDAEQNACLEFLTGSDAAAQEPSALREGLVRALLNHNDFVSIR